MSDYVRRPAGESGSHYDVLGIRPDATSDEIDDQFRALAKVVHPDHGGDAVMFEVLMDSYVVLRDPARRAEYDRSLRAEAAARSRPTNTTSPRARASRPSTSGPSPSSTSYSSYTTGRRYGRFSEAEWQRAMHRSLGRSILATVFRRRSRHSYRGGLWSRPAYEPTTWPLPDPSTAGQFINAVVGSVIMMVMFFTSAMIFMSILFSLVEPTTPAP